MTFQSRNHAKSIRGWILVASSLSLLLVGCQSGGHSEVSANEERAIVNEIEQTLEEYRQAVMRKDLDEMLAFWSDSNDFVFAGDGRILGGYPEWSAETTRHTVETDKWLNWEYKNIHVAVLSADSASCTLEFEFSRLGTDGSTLSMRGAWTYVFKKYGSIWKVVQTNGTHIEL